MGGVGGRRDNAIVSYISPTEIARVASVTLVDRTLATIISCALWTSWALLLTTMQNICTPSSSIFFAGFVALSVCGAVEEEECAEFRGFPLPDWGLTYPASPPLCSRRLSSCGELPSVILY